MNSSFIETVDVGSNFLMSYVTSAFGCVVFVMNACLLSFVIEFLRSGYLKGDTYGIIIQSLFVCINDTLSGLSLFLVGLVEIDSYRKAFICANLVFLCFTSHIVSMGNITCICALRFILSGSLCKTKINWSSTYIKSLLVVNIIIGAGSFVSFLAKMKVKPLQT